MYKPTIKVLRSNLPILLSNLKSTPSNKCRQIPIICSLHLTGRSLCSLCAQADCFCPFVLDFRVLLALLSISSTSHLFFLNLVSPPVSLLLGLLNRIIAVRHFLFAQPFVLFEFSSQSHSPSSSFPSFFFLPGLCHSAHPPSLPPC